MRAVVQPRHTDGLLEQSSCGGHWRPCVSNTEICSLPSWSPVGETGNPITGRPMVDGASANAEHTRGLGTLEFLWVLLWLLHKTILSPNVLATETVKQLKEEGGIFILFLNCLFFTVVFETDFLKAL